MTTQEKSSKSNKFNHAEAFCIMKYKCEACGHIEYLWNSRDGVTPFIIGCKKCKGRSQHDEWARDVSIPNLNPMGIRWFIDLTKEKYLEHIRSVYTKENEPYHGKTAKEVIEILSSFEDWQEGQPHILEINEIHQYLNQTT